MDKVCLFLNRRKQVHTYIPQMEKYIASKETMIITSDVSRICVCRNNT